MAFGIISAALGVGSALLGKSASDDAAEAAEERAEANAKLEKVAFKERQRDREFRINEVMGLTDASFAARGLSIGSESNRAINEASMRDFKHESVVDKKMSRIRREAGLEAGSASAGAMRTRGTMSLLNAAGTFIGAFD